MTSVQRVEPAQTEYALQAPIAKFLQSDPAKAAIVPMLPKGVDYETVLVEVYRAWLNNKDIGECTQASIILAVSSAVQSGLQIGKTVHLVPVNVKVSKKGEPDAWEKRLQAWNDYKGDIELVIGAGGARHIEANPVFANDVFEFELGGEPFVKHRPPMKDRGALIGAYAVAWITPVIKKIDVMPLAEVEAIRAKSKQWANLRECPPWYAVKSVLHRICKTLPKNQRLLQVLATMERQQIAIEGEERELDVSNMVEEIPSGSIEPSAEVIE